MKPTEHAATADQPLDLTGRDGAIDFVARDTALHVLDDQDYRADDRYVRLLGTAIVQLWSELPREVQEPLFERAIALQELNGRDDRLRELLAKFLHDRHARTRR